jgi:tRNA pseudouridine32 synthase/23S rRNA pseudouridine746 synthase
MERTAVREAAIDHAETDALDVAGRVLFIDAEAIVIDKPAGLPVDTPKAGGDSVAARLDELRFGFQRPPRPVHRLDRDTSGCLLLARNPKAASRFHKAFEEGKVEKVYMAVVEGERSGEGVIDLPLAKTSSAEQGWRMIPDEKGKPARTRWKAFGSQEGRTLIEFRPETGRTHQIRAHALYGLDAPIAGDLVYGSGGQEMLLHALRLVVPREKKPAIDVTAPLPERFGEWRDAI